MKVFIGADHRGFELKKQLIEWLQANGHDVTDCGNTTMDPNDDYPDAAIAVGSQVTIDKDSFGVVICGSGTGVTIAANKVLGIRAAQGFNEDSVKRMRSDDNANVLALGSDFVSLDEAKTYLQLFLQTNFSQEERHKRRADKVFSYEYSRERGGCCGGSCSC